MIDPQKVHGAIVHENSKRTDSLIRVSLKAVILDDVGRTLVVKESGRDWWDIPGGSIDHGESLKDALVRELYEEVSLEGEFEFEVLIVEDPHYLTAQNLYQMRITFVVKPTNMDFRPGDDGDEVEFVDADQFEHSELFSEQQIYKLSKLAKSRRF